MESKPITPEDKATLKEQMTSAVESAFADETLTTKEQILEKVEENIKALESEPGMGGLGEEEQKGMPVPDEEAGED